MSRKEFGESTRARLEVFNSMFGMAAVELKCQPKGSDPKRIGGHGSLLNSVPGKFDGTFYYNDLMQLCQDGQLRLDCAVDAGTLSIKFFVPSDSSPRAKFVAPLSEDNKKFSGIFQFSQAMADDNKPW